jgi:hypothetical protein
VLGSDPPLTVAEICPGIAPCERAERAGYAPRREKIRQDWGCGLGRSVPPARTNTTLKINPEQLEADAGIRIGTRFSGE